MLMINQLRSVDSWPLALLFGFMVVKATWPKRRVCTEC